MNDRRLLCKYLHRYSGATSRTPRLEPTDVPKTPVAQAIPGSSDSPERPQAPVSWYDPRGWSLRRRLIVAMAIVVVIVVVIVGTVEGVRANRYPDYTPLNYRIVHTYDADSFFDNFDYFSAEDPTDGFVVYVDEVTAHDLNLTYTTNTSAILRVDSFTPNAVGGRNSVRIESKATYDSGLFVFDIVHTPYGCGTWPALWLTDGYNWPMNGEIDILESTNEASQGNEVTLHTTEGCKMNVKRKETGSPVFKSCDNSTHGNAGCAVQGEPSTYGQAMNTNGGGVYALELRDAGIRVWFFPRDAIPDDLCDIGSHFRNQSIIVNIDLCGELASQPMYYDDMYNCPATCPEFVANNPTSFEEAYWEFGGFKVYQAV
ncbi:uncharacterized protein N7459_006374 [Penicillium hispanicum]|uniref:uncharacterized protein n=1 Tax=Penicillium hispanicum TaxID=1080232 RepID=UPI002542560A|nr:uncharacterized protein N7459_006374 [Penicillium hispanicum]KAJ5577410.1 hypothetical protein N7459_006374 [Penicillium hispanicum]